MSVADRDQLVGVLSDGGVVGAVRLRAVAPPRRLVEARLAAAGLRGFAAAATVGLGPGFARVVAVVAAAAFGLGPGLARVVVAAVAAFGLGPRFAPVAADLAVDDFAA